jgi:hypothetical protein
MTDHNEATLGVYAATADKKKVSLILINKDATPVALAISGVPAGTYFLRHFGGTSLSFFSFLFSLTDSGFRFLRRLKMADYDHFLVLDGELPRRPVVRSRVLKAAVVYGCFMSHALGILK